MPSRFATPARNDSYADDTRAPLMQPAPRRGNSRQTDFKGPPLQRIARFCHALFLLSVTGKQRFKCSESADVLGPFASRRRSVRIGPSSLARFVGAAGRV